MPSILLVCTGNVCRSPVAQAALARALRRRLGDQAPTVSSAGTAGWQGSAATPQAVEAAADLVVCMAAEHRDEVDSPKAFTLKELVRLLDSLSPPDANDTLTSRVQNADAARAAGVQTNPWDQDVQDPMGLSYEAYRAICWEIVEWSDRLVAGLYD